MLNSLSAEANCRPKVTCILDEVTKALGGKSQIIGAQCVHTRQLSGSIEQLNLQSPKGQISLRLLEKHAV